MRIISIKLMLILLLTAVAAIAQTRIFTKDDLDYVVELPSLAWQPVSRLDVHDHLDFIVGGDPANGYLRLRKTFVTAGATPMDLFLTSEKWELKSLPGYVACGDCSGERFDGNLKGAAFAYEYTSGGRAIAGRIYYLQLDSRTYYELHFTVRADKLASLRGDMDSIARSFHMK